MLKPAICYKEQIENALAEYFYTNDMMYYMGYIGNGLITISDKSDNGNYQDYQFAVVNNKEELIGYIAYSVDYYSSCAYNFGAFSFDRGNPIMAKEMYDLVEKLLKRFHRIEFRAVSGNPATKGYDRFLAGHSKYACHSKYECQKFVFKDVFRDTEGHFHDEYIYELINKEIEV